MKKQTFTAIIKDYKCQPHIVEFDTNALLGEILHHAILTDNVIDGYNEYILKLEDAIITIMAINKAHRVYDIKSVKIVEHYD